MGMLEFYPQIKWVHVAAVITSGSVFALRGLLVLASQRPHDCTQSPALWIPAQLAYMTTNTPALDSGHDSAACAAVTGAKIAGN